MTDSTVANAASDDAPRYAAFLSYSHQDEEIGAWLQKRLEDYRVPQTLVGRAGAHGRIGKRLGKVFRDRADLSASHDLGAEIRLALERAGALIVLCSPRSCRSKYVHEEIRTFKQLGKGDRIFAAIVDGEPHAAGKPGYTAEQECFAPALIYRIGEDGAVTGELEAAEVLAADFRPGRDGRENGALKLIAGLLDLNLDDLVQREQQAERRRRLRANAIVAAMAVLTVAAIGGGAIAWQQRGAARDTLHRSFAARAWERLDADDISGAARYALAGARVARGDDAPFRDALAAIMHRAGDGVSPLWHDQPVGRARFSPDGARIVTSAGAFESPAPARVWDAATGRLLHTFAPPDPSPDVGHGGIDAIYTPDGSAIVTADWSGNVYVWDANTFALLHTLEGHSDRVSLVAFAPDGSRFVTQGSRFGNSRLWDGRTFAYLATMQSNNAGSPRDVAFSPDSARFVIARGSGQATVDFDYEPQVYDARDGSPLFSLVGHTDSVVSCVFSPDGATILTASGDFSARIWDARTGALLRTLLGHRGPLRGASFSPDGARALTVSADGSARIWNVSDGRLELILTGHEGPVNAARFSPDGQRIATASSDGDARIYAADDGRLLSRLVGHAGQIADIVFTDGGRRVVTSSEDGSVRIWSGAADRRVAAVASETSDFDSPFAVDNTRVFTATGAGTIGVWALEDGRALTQFGAGLDFEFGRTAVTPDGRRIVTSQAHTDPPLTTVWDGASFAPILSLPSAGLRVAIGSSGEWALAGGVAWNLAATPPRRLAVDANYATAHMDPTGRYVLALPGTDDADVIVWDLTAGRPAFSIPFRFASSTHIAAFAPDGGTLFVEAENDRQEQSAGGDIFSVPDGRRIGAVPRRGGALRSAAFSNDGAMIVIVRDWPSAVEVYRARDAALMVTMPLRADAATSAGFSPDGRFIVASYLDGVAVVWSVLEGRRLAVFGDSARFRRHETNGIVVRGASRIEMTHAQFALNGARIVTRSTAPQGSIEIWDTTRLSQPLAQLSRDACDTVLGPQGRRFTETEFHADALLVSEWGAASRDVCEGVAGAAPLEAGPGQAQ